MKFLLVSLFLFNLTFAQEDFSPLFVSNKNEFQYYDIDFYDELDQYLPLLTTNITTNYSFIVYTNTTTNFEGISHVIITNFNENANFVSNIIVTNFITNQASRIKRTPKAISPVPKSIYNPMNFININGFFIDIQSGNSYKVLDALKNKMHPDVRGVQDIKNGPTPLIMAASYRRALISKILLYQGADPNLSTHTHGISNITPLMIAAQQGPVEVVRDLLDFGAKVDTQTSGRTSGNTAIMVAIKNKHLDMVKLLLSYDANVNLVTTSGQIKNISPLMLAAQTGDLEMVKLLTEVEGIDLFAEDSERKNALVYAYISGNIALISYLGSLGITTDLSSRELQRIVKKYI